MIVYGLLLLYFVIGAALERAQQTATAGQVHGASLPLRLGGLLVALVVGLRFQIGADWYTYLEIFHQTAFVGFGTALEAGDPGYQAVNWLVQHIGADMWLVNLTCALIFAWGLIRFAETMPRPWLTMVVAVPYLVTVVAMGYTRQAVAIGIIMAGLAVYLRTGSTLRLAAYVLVAALFHKTAVVVLPLAVIGNGRSRVAIALVALAITYELYNLFLVPSLGGLEENYSSYQSQGALVRVVMSAVAAVLYLLRRRYIHLGARERGTWRNFSLASLAALFLLFVMPLSSTAIDRMALYLIPLQLAVLARPRVASTTEGLGTSLIIIYSALVQFTWLTFAAHADYWVPYHFWPFFT